jgi:NAD(P)-dependent dehydrogenase (short-subunit alcohol dehydrogenase family)
MEALMRYKRVFSLDDKVVFIAGGAGAIGAEMARACADYGAKVAVADLSPEAAGQVAQELSDGGAAATSVAVNITDADSTAQAVAEAEATLGPLDVMINAAGIHIEKPAEEYDMASWDKVLAVNLKGGFVLSQAAARSMIARGEGGSIIHVTSVRSGLGIRRGYASYVASKGGLALLIKQLATEWAKYQIRVNGIAPTFTRTPLVTEYLNDPEFYGALVERIPMGRVCETQDLAGIALFLASDASSFITGQNIFVDGGVTATQ